MNRKLLTYKYLNNSSAGLDPFSKRRLWKLIKEHVAKYESSVILTTHDMNEASFLSDDIAMLINGSIV